MAKKLREIKLSMLALAPSLGVGCDSDEEIIISLTSFPARFSRLHIVLEALLRQSFKPSRVCLWIGCDDYDLLPTAVTRLKRRGVEIIACEDTRSFKKIIPCLRANPGSIVVTADDDVLYPSDWLENLVKASKANPGQIICHRARYINFSPKGTFAPYMYWQNLSRPLSSFLVFPVGVGGVLYPVGSLCDSVFDSEKFLKLCPYADDVWLKVMSLRRGTRCYFTGCYKKNFKELAGSQVESLKEHNVSGRNDQQMDLMNSEYKVVELLKELD